MTYQDFPIEELLPAMEQFAAHGHLTYFKFTCAHCGSRQTSGTANTYHTQGYTCKACGTLTVPTAGNYLLILRAPKKERKSPNL